MTAPCIDRPKTLCYPTAAHRLLLPPVNLKAANDKTHGLRTSGRDHDVLTNADGVARKLGRFIFGHREAAFNRNSVSDYGLPV